MAINSIENLTAANTVLQLIHNVNEIRSQAANTGSSVANTTFQSALANTNSYIADTFIGNTAFTSNTTFNGNFGIGSTTLSEFHTLILGERQSSDDFATTLFTPQNSTTRGFNVQAFDDNTSSYYWRIYDQTAAAERLRINSSGQLGIGITSSVGGSSELLTVAGSVGMNRSGSVYINIEDTSQVVDEGTWRFGIAAGDIRLQTVNDAYSATADAYRINRGTGTAVSEHIWYTSGAEAMRIDSSGNVLVGATSQSASGKMELSNSTGNGFYVNYDGTSNNEYGLRIESNAGGGNFESDFAVGSTALLDLYANSAVTSGGDILVARTQAAAPVFIVRGNGRAGLGTATPDGTLHVHTASAGAVTANAVADDLVIEQASNGGMSILTPNTTTGSFFFGDPDNSAVGRIQYNHTNDYMALYTSGTEAMRIDSSGNVGIGTTSPNGKLEVVGSVIADNLKDGGQIETVADQEYVFFHSARSGTYTSISAITDTGSCDVLLAINSSNTSGSTVSANSSSYNSSNTFSQAISQGDKVGVWVVNNSSATQLTVYFNE